MLAKTRDSYKQKFSSTIFNFVIPFFYRLSKDCLTSPRSRLVYELKNSFLLKKLNGLVNNTVISCDRDTVTGIFFKLCLEKIAKKVLQFAHPAKFHLMCL